MCLVFGYDWIEEVDYINVFFYQFVCYLLGQGGIVQYYWNDWVFVWQQVKIGGVYVGMEMFGIVEQVGVQIIIFIDYVQCFE